MFDFFYEIIEFKGQVVSWANYFINGCQSFLTSFHDTASNWTPVFTALDNPFSWLLTASVIYGVFRFLRGHG